jgi:peptidyl-prolyl cis-trans isomerase D
MVNLLRKHQQPLMIFITVVIIIAFVVFYNGNSSAKHRGLQQGFRIYGRNYSQEEIQRKVRQFSVAMRAGLGELVYGLTGNPNSEQAVENFVWNSFVLDHEAERLGITANTGEVVAAMEKLPPFQTNGAFDPSKYQGFLDNLLRPNGFTAQQLEDLVRDQLRLEKLVALVGSTAEITPAEFRASYIQEHQKMHLSVIRFDLAGFKAQVQPAEDEIKKVYEERKASLNTGEKRTISYVQIDLNGEQKALKGKELVDARQALADRASDFGQAMLDPKANFVETARKMGLQVKTTPEFAQAQPPAELSQAPELAAAAFQLTEKEPTSDALSVGNGYIILHLEKVIPSRPLTFEEARPQVVEQIKAERGNQLLISKANEAAEKIAAALKAGKSFADAAAEAGQKVETLPAFSLSEPLEGQANFQEIVSKAVELGEGELSALTPVENGAFIVHLDKRDPIDEAQFQKDQKTQMASARMGKNYVAFHEWLQSRRKSADIKNIGPQRSVQE